MVTNSTDEIAAELLRVEEAVEHSKESQFASAKLWRSMNLMLGVPASAVAAVGGVQGVAGTVSAETVGVLALVAAVLGGIMTTINAGQRADQASAAANAYLTIHTDARVLRNIDLPNSDYDTAREALGTLLARRDEVNHTAPVPGKVAHMLGQRNIKKGRTKYGVDK